jgi:hypothetical protein
MFTEQRFTHGRRVCAVVSSDVSAKNVHAAPSPSTRHSGNGDRMPSAEPEQVLVSGFFSIHVAETLRPLCLFIAQAARILPKIRASERPLVLADVWTERRQRTRRSHKTHNVKLAQLSEGLNCSAQMCSADPALVSTGQGDVETVSCPNRLLSKDQVSTGQDDVETVSCPNVLLSKGQVSTGQDDVETVSRQNRSSRVETFSGKASVRARFAFAICIMFMAVTQTVAMQINYEPSSDASDTECLKFDYKRMERLSKPISIEYSNAGLVSAAANYLNMHVVTQKLKYRLYNKNKEGFLICQQIRQQEGVVEWIGQERDWFLLKKGDGDTVWTLVAHIRPSFLPKYWDTAGTITEIRGKRCTPVQIKTPLNLPLAMTKDKKISGRFKSGTWSFYDLREESYLDLGDGFGISELLDFPYYYLLHNKNMSDSDDDFLGEFRVSFSSSRNEWTKISFENEYDDTQLSNAEKLKLFKKAFPELKRRRRLLTSRPDRPIYRLLKEIEEAQNA